MKEGYEPTLGREKEDAAGERTEFNAGSQEGKAVRPGKGSCLKLPCFLHCWCDKNVNDTKMTPPGVMS